MTITKKQFRVTFENHTAFSNKRASTIWYNSIEECEKWIHKTRAEIITRDLVKDTEEFKILRNAKFNS